MFFARAGQPPAKASGSKAAAATAKPAKSKAAKPTKKGKPVPKPAGSVESADVTEASASDVSGRNGPDGLETSAYQDVEEGTGTARRPTDDTEGPGEAAERADDAPADDDAPVLMSRAGPADAADGPLLIRLVDESGNRIEQPTLEFLSSDDSREEPIPGERKLDLAGGRWRVMVACAASTPPTEELETAHEATAETTPDEPEAPAEPPPPVPVVTPQGETLLEKLKSYYEQSGHPWDELNLLGIRCVDVKYTGQYKDLLVVADDKRVVVLRFTTHYGLGWTPAKMKKYGITYCADYVPGYYADSHTVWNHRGYEALSQRSPVKLYVDDKFMTWFRKSKDGKKTEQFDEATSIFTTGDSDGMNIHKSGGDWGYSAKTDVGVASAGCQVMCSHRDFKWFMSKVTGTRKYKKLGRGNVRYSYWLVESDAFPLYEEIKAVKRGAP